MLVGRDRETAAIDGVLFAAREGRSGVLVIRGEAGMGKSALLRYALESADGFTVLNGAGIESESQLAFSTLHQLLRPVLDRVDALPAPQAAALRAAFALSDEAVPDRFHVSLGVLGLLSEAAEEAPLLCVVDDAHWLDQASADALVFSARRLEVEPIALLFAVRDGDQAFSVPDVLDLRPARLEAEDAHEFVKGRLGATAAPGVVDWVVASANGNPLALVELPAALNARQLAGLEPLDGELPPTTSVEQSYLERVGRLPPSVQSLLLVVACDETGDRAILASAASELGLNPDDLTVAEAAGLVEVRRDRIDFVHPLMRSALYRGAGFVERERAHRALASAVSGPNDADRWAWHVAAATIGPDESVAADLERTAERARLRGGPGASAAALERAAGLTPDSEERGRRLSLAAWAAWHAGQPERTEALLDQASPSVVEPALRAELDHLRGLVQLRCGSLLEAGPILVAGADAVAELDARKAREMLLDAGSAAAKSGDVAGLVDVAERAAALPVPGDESERLRIDLLVAITGITAGKTRHEVPLLEDAIARATEFDDPQLLSWAATGAAAIGDEETEAAHLRHAIAVARDSGAVDTLVLVLESAVNSAMLAGRYQVEEEATEGLRLAREVGLTNAATAHLAALAWLAGMQGREDDCRTFAAEVVMTAPAAGLANANSAAEWGVALLDLGAGRYADATARFMELRRAPRGSSHPLLVLTSTPDLVEAFVRAGQTDEARRAFAPLDAFAKPTAPRWIIALAARCRGLLLEGDEAERAFLDAMRLHGTAGRLFDRGRTELVYGEFLRRERRKTDARDLLRSAASDFEHFRAEPWAERARLELRATGETLRRRDPATFDELTPQERQIALLVGEGQTNKDVAAQLFLSPRTVEYHLRKVFTKLGISSRAELIRGREATLVS
jgi:DNA-binding CsgD family transcriptional regulator